MNNISEKDDLRRRATEQAQGFLRETDSKAIGAFSALAKLASVIHNGTDFLGERFTPDQLATLKREYDELKKKAAEDFANGDIERFEAGTDAFAMAQNIVYDSELMDDGTFEMAKGLMEEHRAKFNRQE